MLGPLATLGNGAGLSASSSAESATGTTSIGGFTFNAGGKLPAVAWVAIGAVALIVLLKVLR